MNVASILKVKGREVYTVAAETSLIETVRILSKNRIGCVVVVGGEGKVAGIMSERDVVRTLAERGPDALTEPVRNFMTKDVITCRETDTIDHLMATMTTQRFRHLPVIAAGGLGGLVSIGDVVKFRIAEAELEAAAMRDYIATG